MFVGVVSEVGPSLYHAWAGGHPQAASLKVQNVRIYHQSNSENTGAAYRWSNHQLLLTVADVSSVNCAASSLDWEIGHLGSEGACTASTAGFGLWWEGASLLSC